MKKLIEQLKRHEGFRGTPYKDTVGKLTIGYGRNLDDRGITPKEAEKLLKNDISSSKSALFHKIPWVMRLDEVRQEALINMTYNMGIYGLMGFKNMLTALQYGDYNRVYKEALNSKWAKQVGKRAEEIALQLKTGKYKEV